MYSAATTHAVGSPGGGWRPAATTRMVPSQRRGGNRTVVSDRELFRQAFRRWATTVVVVTYRDDEDRPVGMTATSMSSLSADPPSLLVCINRETRAHPIITKRAAFGIDMLSIGQRPIADHCSAAGRDKLLHPSWLASGGADQRLGRVPPRWPTRSPTSTARWTARSRPSRTRS